MYVDVSTRGGGIWIHESIWKYEWKFVGNLYALLAHLCSAQKPFLNTSNYYFVKIIIFPTNIMPCLISCPILQFLSHFFGNTGCFKKMDTISNHYCFEIGLIFSKHPVKMRQTRENSRNDCDLRETGNVIFFNKVYYKNEAKFWVLVLLDDRHPS